jgi:hypothetical protein
VHCHITIVSSNLYQSITFRVTNEKGDGGMFVPNLLAVSNSGYSNPFSETNSASHHNSVFSSTQLPSHTVIPTSLSNDASQSQYRMSGFNFSTPQHEMSTSPVLFDKRPHPNPSAKYKARQSRPPGLHIGINTAAPRGTRSQAQHVSWRPGSTPSPITHQKSKKNRHSASRKHTLKKLLSTYLSSPSFKGLRQLHDEALLYGEEFDDGYDGRSTSDMSSSFHSFAASELSDNESQTDVTSIASMPRQKEIDANSLNDTDDTSVDEQPQTASDSKPQYPCTLEGCNKVSHNASEFQRHEKNKGHYNQERYMCVPCLCPDYLSGDAICQLCESPFTMHESLEAHYRRCLPTLTTQPTKATFTRNYHATKHLVEKHGYTRVAANGYLPNCKYLLNDDWPKECKLCDETFETLEERSKHILWHYKRGDTWPKSDRGPGHDSDNDDDKDDDHDDGKPPRKKSKSLSKASAKRTEISSSRPSQVDHTSSSRGLQSRDTSPTSSDESGGFFDVSREIWEEVESVKLEEDVVTRTTSNALDRFSRAESPTTYTAEARSSSATQQHINFDLFKLRSLEKVSREPYGSTILSTRVPVMAKTRSSTTRQTRADSASSSASTLLMALNRAQSASHDGGNNGPIPVKEIKRLMTAEMIQRELLSYTRRHNTWLLKSAARSACDIKKYFPRLFAILVIIGKGSSIKSFMKENINDRDLPLVRNSGPNADSYRLNSKLSPNVLIKCMSDWAQETIDAFDREQWVFGSSQAEHYSQVLMELKEQTGMDSQSSRHQKLNDHGISYQMRRFLKEGDELQPPSLVPDGNNIMIPRSPPPSTLKHVPLSPSLDTRYGVLESDDNCCKRAHHKSSKQDDAEGHDEIVCHTLDTMYPSSPSMPKPHICLEQPDYSHGESKYQVRNHDYKKVFKPGRVFSTLWAVPASGNTNNNETLLSYVKYGDSTK